MNEPRGASSETVPHWLCLNGSGALIGRESHQLQFYPRIHTWERLCAWLISSPLEKHLFQYVAGSHSVIQQREYTLENFASLGRISLEKSSQEQLLSIFEELSKTVTHISSQTGIFISLSSHGAARSSESIVWELQQASKKRNGPPHYTERQVWRFRA